MKSLTENTHSGLYLAIKPRLLEKSRDGNAIVLKDRHRQLSIVTEKRGVLDALTELLSEAASQEQLNSFCKDPSEIAELKQKLQEMKNANFITYQLQIKSDVLLKITPVDYFDGPQFSPIETTTIFELSRFAYFRREEEQLLLESPLADFYLSADSKSGAEVLTRLVFGCSAQQLCDWLGQNCLPAVVDLLGLLCQSHFIQPQGSKEADDLLTWEFHDLLFHRSSRINDAQREYASFRFKEGLKPPPAFKEIMSAHRIGLEKPDLKRLEITDPPFTKVLESRRSIREIANRSITLDELSEFLYRTAHIKEVYELNGIQRMRRAYPAGGGLHELEFYVVCNQCNGLEQGIYHYRPEEHALYKLSVSPHVIDRLLSRSAKACAIDKLPQVLIVLTSKFGRMSYKYESIAYRATLLNVGVVQQTMYLIATAMGLSPCALGSGWLRWLGQNTGLDWIKEGAIGEFMINAAPDQTAT